MNDNNNYNTTIDDMVQLQILGRGVKRQTKCTKRGAFTFANFINYDTL